MKRENEIIARLKDIISTLETIKEGTFDYDCLLQKKELLEWVLNKKFIDYKGFRYYYEYRKAVDNFDICLATKDPKEYCNGFYLYSDKDPGSSMAFVVIYHNNPSGEWYVN